MMFGWMFVIGYTFMSLMSALAIYAACIMANRSPGGQQVKRHDAGATCDVWRNKRVYVLHAAVQPNLLLPRKGGH